MALSTSEIKRQPSYKWGAISYIIALIVILLAFAFEYVGGYKACELCIQQRYSYYLGIPILFIALLFVGLEKRGLAITLFLLTSLIFLLNVFLGSYHAGIEWGFWDGSTTCNYARHQHLVENNEGILALLQEMPTTSCGHVAWRFLGLSFAGWNVISSLILTICCIRAASSYNLIYTN
ncbi:MAG: disulfide bond formation protein B [Hyphomicrobiaceae bacterium]|nr:disulfide bond formation protein B [Hyphomicrobiaceae bacterium]